MVIELDSRYMKFDGDLLLTTACPVECDFCVYYCTASKEVEKWMPEKTIKRVAEEYSKNDIGIRISGGEPFYDLSKLEKCIDILLRYYYPHQLLIISSGYWAHSKKMSKENLKIIKQKGFDKVMISADIFHIKKIPLKNIENFVKVSKDLGLNNVIRITLTGMPEKTMENLIRIIIKYQPKIELHSTGFVGRAEQLLNYELNSIKKIRKDYEKRKNLFISKFRKIAKNKKVPIDIDFYLTYAAKRRQIDEALEFFPTTFPNGNVYGCSSATKTVFMGNINKYDLKAMIIGFKKTIPGTVIFKESVCANISRYLSPLDENQCDFCKDQPFYWKEPPELEYRGRKFIQVNLKNINKVHIKYDKIHELLLSIQLNEYELHPKSGEKILNFIEDLEKKMIRFKLSRALPPCLFNPNHLNKIKLFNIPKNCFECHELFSVENGKVILCPNVYQKKDISFENIKDRKCIFEHFVTLHKSLKLNKRCHVCIYFIRNQCNGLCFRNTN